MVDLSSPHLWLIVGIIFSLRLISWALDAIRLLFIMHDRMLLVWLLGVFGVLSFLVAFSIVINEINNPLYILSFISGSATGSLVGMMVEERLALGFIRITIVSPTLGTVLAGKLRSDGYAVTEIPGYGKGGMVTTLRCNVLRKQVKGVETIATTTDPSAFIFANEVRMVRRGFWKKLV